jgi:hypothetical protein
MLGDLLFHILPYRLQKSVIFYQLFLILLSNDR